MPPVLGFRDRKQAMKITGAMPRARRGKLSTPSRIRNSVMPEAAAARGMAMSAPVANALAFGVVELSAAVTPSSEKATEVIGQLVKTKSGAETTTPRKTRRALRAASFFSRWIGRCTARSGGRPASIAAISRLARSRCSATSAVKRASAISRGSPRFAAVSRAAASAAGSSTRAAAASTVASVSTWRISQTARAADRLAARAANALSPAADCRQPSARSLGRVRTSSRTRGQRGEHRAHPVGRHVLVSQNGAHRFLDLPRDGAHPSAHVGVKLRCGKGIVDERDRGDAEHHHADAGDAGVEDVLRRVDLHHRDDRDGVAREHGAVGAVAVVAARDVDAAGQPQGEGDHEEVARLREEAGERDGGEEADQRRCGAEERLLQGLTALGLRQDRHGDGGGRGAVELQPEGGV